MPNRTTLLVLGAIVGALLAASGVLQPSSAALSPNDIATVNGDSIAKSDYLYYLSTLSKDRRSALGVEERQRVLDRLIDEKLLLRRGIDLGLPWSDAAVSKALTNAMIDTILADSAAALPEESALENFFAENRSYFSAPTRLRVQRMEFRGADASERAQSAWTRLENETWDDVSADLPGSATLSLPASMLSEPKLRTYIGKELTEVSLALKPGEHSAPVPDGNGYSIMRLLGLQPGTTPVYEDVRAQVLQEYQRRVSEDALRRYLEQLRDEAQIQVDHVFLQSLSELRAGDNNAQP